MLTADNFAEWPDSARRISEVLGVPATIRLHEAMAGQRFHIGLTAPMPAPIVEVLGLEGAELLRQVLGNRHHDFPRGYRASVKSRNTELWAAHAAGVPTRELARHFKLTDRRARQLIADRRR